MKYSIIFLATMAAVAVATPLTADANDVSVAGGSGPVAAAVPQNVQADVPPAETSGKASLKAARKAARKSGKGPKRQVRRKRKQRARRSRRRATKRATKKAGRGASKADAGMGASESHPQMSAEPVPSPIGA